VIRQLLTSLNGQLAILCPLSIVQLDLFTHLKDGSMSVEEIARRVDVRADKLKPLLYALAAFRLSTVESGFFPTPEATVVDLAIVPLITQRIAPATESVSLRLTFSLINWKARLTQPSGARSYK
jgi:hypothetical protein